MRYRNIAVTGGSGRLGRHVVELLAPEAEVTVIDIAPPARGDVAHENVSITDTEALKRVFAGKDAVVHLAAIPNPRTASPEKCFSVNTTGTWAVLQAAEDAGVKRIVVCSSDSTTGLHYNPEDWAPRYIPVDEEHPLRAIEPYSLSKVVTEVVAKSFADRGKLEVLVIRPSHIVFEPEYPEIGDRGGDVQNYHLWGYVAPEDVAEGFRLALEIEDGSYDIFFIAAEDGMNTRPTLELLEERFGTVPEVRNPALYEKNPTAAVFGIEHARRKLGYQPRKTWRDFKAG